MDAYSVEHLLRTLGSQGTFRGHSALIKITEARIAGKSIETAITQVAGQEGITIKVLKSRIKTLIKHMETVKTEHYCSFIEHQNQITLYTLVEYIKETVSTCNSGT